MTTYLLDTHVLLWANAEPERLSASARTVLEDGSSVLLVSSVSAAEIEIKRSIGKLKMSHSCQALVEQLDAQWIDLTPGHAMGLRELPQLHRDPFDRLLLAQALVDDIVLMSGDGQVLQYPVTALDVR